MKRKKVDMLMWVIDSECGHKEKKEQKKRKDTCKKQLGLYRWNKSKSFFLSLTFIIYTSNGFT